MPRVQLHCPSTGMTVDDHMIGSAMSPAAAVTAVRVKLGLRHAVLFTPEAKPIADPKTLEEGSQILVAASADEKMLPDAPQGWVFYEGEEGEDVDQDSDVYDQAWETLDDNEMCLHITSINEKKPWTRNKMRITRKYDPVEKDLTAINTSSPPSSTSATPEELIEQRWGTTLEIFLPSEMKPDKNKTVSKSLDPRAIATIGVLSSCTQGQPRLARESLVEAVALRTDADQQDETEKDPVVRTQDVAVAIEIMYERAGLRPVKITKVKSETAKGKEKARAAKGKKKAAGKGKKKDGEGDQGGEGGQAVAV